MKRPEPFDSWSDQRRREVQQVIKDRMKVDENGCWRWRLGKCRGGYGRITIEQCYTSAHRVSYAAFHGPIPDGLHIHHACKVRDCVNPWHLEAVTQAENNRLSPERKQGWQFNPGAALGTLQARYRRETGGSCAAVGDTGVVKWAIDHGWQVDFATCHWSVEDALKSLGYCE